MVSYAGDRRALAVPTVRSIVNHVLERERTDADITVTFLSAPRMRGLNRRTFGRDRATDVIAFPLTHGDQLIGDVYVCPGVARTSARSHGIPVRHEMIRLVTHGVLHVIGYDHPAGAAARLHSDMWRRQERYVNELVS